MEKQTMDLTSLANELNITKKDLLKFMLKQNKDVDYQNIGTNDFKNKKQVNEWWKQQSSSMIVKIYDEYYGLEELLENY
jgi:hypothetical protein